MRTFRDAAAEEQFVRDGYAVIDLLDPVEVGEANHLAGSLDRTTPDVFQATLYASDAGYRRTVDTTLRPLFARALAPHLVDQRAFVANLLIKPPGPGTGLGVHQDWTFVDEPELTSATVWCPLVDVDERNGTLTVLERSHLMGPTWRGSPKLPSPFDGLEPVIVDLPGTVLRCRAGQAVVYDHRLLHWSGANRSDQPRVAVGVGIAPRDAPLRHIHLDDDGRAVRYTVPDDFLLDLEFGRPPARFTEREVMVIPERTLTEDDLRTRSDPSSRIRERWRPSRWARR